MQSNLIIYEKLLNQNYKIGGINGKILDKLKMNTAKINSGRKVGITVNMTI